MRILKRAQTFWPLDHHFAIYTTDVAILQWTSNMGPASAPAAAAAAAEKREEGSRSSDDDDDDDDDEEGERMMTVHVIEGAVDNMPGDRCVRDS
jgi:hypothetical protein